MDDLYWESPRVNAWIKDRHSKYVKCSEGFAQHSGLDSPAAIIGKHDTDLIWHESASLIIKEDKLIIAGLQVINAQHFRPTSKGVKTLLINKQLQKNWLTGNAVDITGRILMEQNGRWNIQTGKFEVNNIHLTQKEVEVVRLLLVGLSSKLMAIRLNISIKTVEQRIESLRRKFNAGSKVVLTETLHQFGLAYLASKKDQLLN